jgi:hypothetical protein
VPATVNLPARVRRALLKIDGVVEAPGVFNEGDAMWVNGTQIAHFIDDHQMEIRLTKREISSHRPRLKADSRVELRKNASDWMKVTITSPSDLPFVVELAELAASAHRAPNGTTPKAPPTGADLERRRRFH